MAAVVPAAPSRARWIHRASIDVPMAFAWVPFGALVVAFRGTPGAVATIAGATLLFSLAHQPLTLGLIYGDPRQFAVKPRTFIIGPFILAGLVWLGMTVSIVAVGVIGGLWNAEHTLMQRFGLTRIYGRKGGDDHGGLEKPMLISWLAVVLLWAAADPRTSAALVEVGLSRRNASGVEALQTLAPWAIGLLVPVAMLSAWLTWRWITAERALDGAHNPAKHLYVGTTLLLFVVIVIDPVVGFVGYVGAHAAEYFIIIHQTLRTRYVETDDPSLVGRASRTPFGRAGAIAGFLLTLAGIGVLIRSNASAQVYTAVVLTMGAMHIYFDGFIWKLRRPEVAKTFQVT